jgi:benzoate/toluate 1,2-dioxygenase reductase subunit
MLEVLVKQGCTQPVHLVYGVTRDQDLVMLAELESFTQRLPGFSYTTCVVDPESRHERKGYVTQHLDPAHWHDGQVDVYLCGPPPMVDAVSQFIDAQAHAPANFYYEKFITSQ